MYDMTFICTGPILHRSVANVFIIRNIILIQMGMGKMKKTKSTNLYVVQFSPVFSSVSVNKCTD